MSSAHLLSDETSNKTFRDSRFKNATSLLAEMYFMARHKLWSPCRWAFAGKIRLTNINLQNEFMSELKETRTYTFLSCRYSRTNADSSLIIFICFYFKMEKENSDIQISNLLLCLLVLLEQCLPFRFELCLPFGVWEKRRVHCWILT